MQVSEERLGARRHTGLRRQTERDRDVRGHARASDALVRTHAARDVHGEHGDVVASQPARDRGGTSLQRRTSTHAQDRIDDQSAGCRGVVERMALEHRHLDADADVAQQMGLGGQPGWSHREDADVVSCGGEQAGRDEPDRPVGGGSGEDRDRAVGGRGAREHHLRGRRHRTPGLLGARRRSEPVRVQPRPDRTDLGDTHVRDRVLRDLRERGAEPGPPGQPGGKRPRFLRATGTEIVRRHSPVPSRQRRIEQHADHERGRSPQEVVIELPRPRGPLARTVRRVPPPALLGERVEPDVQDLCDLARLDHERMRGVPAGDDRDDPEPRRGDVEGRTVTQHADAARIEPDLLRGLAQCRLRRRLPRLDAATGEGQLPRVRAQVGTPPRQDQPQRRLRVLTLLEQDEHGTDACPGRRPPRVLGDRRERRIETGPDVVHVRGAHASSRAASASSESASLTTSSGRPSSRSARDSTIAPPCRTSARPG